MSHLIPAAEKLLELPNEERIDHVRKDVWIDYLAAQRVTTTLSELLHWPRTQRMPNLLIIGHTNNGKSALVETFRKDNPPVTATSPSEPLMPIVYVEPPGGASEHLFYDALLSGMYAPFKPNDRLGRKVDQSLRMLEYLGTKMLVIDEIHQLLQGTPAKQRHMLGILRFLGNRLRMPIIGIGTREAVNLIRSDPQMANRFDVTELPRWKLDQEFMNLVATFEAVLPLKKPSNLATPRMLRRLMALSEGTIGDLRRLLVRAAVYAISSGREVIDDHGLAAIDWTPPSERRAGR